MTTLNNFRRSLSLLALFVASWLLWSGMFKPLLLILGVVSCAFCLYLAHRVGFFKSASGLHTIPKLPVYWLWLMKEVTKSSFDVAKLVLHPKLPISPIVIEFDAQAKGAVGQAILGNAITLSPGTVTLDIHDGHLIVHCLTEESARELVSGDTNRRTAALTSK